MIWGNGRARRRDDWIGTEEASTKGKNSQPKVARQDGREAEVAGVRCEECDRKQSEQRTDEGTEAETKTREIERERAREWEKGRNQ